MVIGVQIGEFIKNFEKGDRVMRTIRIILILMVILGLSFACKRTGTERVKVPAEKKIKTEEESYTSGINVERGRELFMDERFSSRKVSRSCNSCHPNGKGLEKAGGKDEFNIMGQRQGSLEDAVNFCIEKGLKGKAIDPNGQEMKDIVAYIRSLKQK